MGSGTFTLSWITNGQRITTNLVPHDADIATTNPAVADATRKDQRDMLQKLIKARRVLSAAKQNLASAKTAEAAIYKRETDLAAALKEAYAITCRARVLTMGRAKAVRQAEEEIGQIKNVIGGADYGGHADVVAVAVTKASEAADVAEAAKEKATDAFNEMLALKASLAEMDADVAADIARWANNN